MKKMKIAPSILSADFRTLEREVKTAQDCGADYIHCDVMDGHFVPNISFGPLVVAAVKKCVSIPLDVHLMLSKPLGFIRSFADAGADIITVHAECSDPLDDLIGAIKTSGAKVGVTVNPDKPIDLFLPRLDSINQVLIMTVYAGFGGQKFIPETMQKVRAVYDEAKRRGLEVDIEVDGGVNAETSRICAEHGANVFVAGAYVFGSPDYAQRIRNVRDGALQGATSLH